MNIRYWLACTNLLGVWPLIKSPGILKRVLVIFVMAASALMHISESKHGLDPGLFWSPWSNWLLNADRGVAVMVSFYGLWLWARNGRSMSTLGLALAGLCASALGELTDSLFWYGTLHTGWHVAVYTAMYREFAHPRIHMKNL